MQRGRRPVRAQLLKDAMAGKFQVILCWKIDPVGRSVKDFIHNVEALNEVGVRFICAAHPIIDTDARNPSGQMQMAILRVLAEFERDLFAERVQIGVARARKEQAVATIVGYQRPSKSGKNLSHGAPRKIWRRGRAGELRALGMSIRKIAEELGTTYGSVRRALKANGDAGA